MDKLLKPVEVAEMLKVHISTVRRLYQDGELEYRRLGHRTIRIYQTSVEAYLDRERPIESREVPNNEPFTIDFTELPPAGV